MPQKPRKQFLPSESSKSNAPKPGGRRRKGNPNDDRQKPLPLYSSAGKPRYTRSEDERPFRGKKDFSPKFPRRKNEESDFRRQDSRRPSKPYASAKWSEDKQGFRDDRNQDKRFSPGDKPRPFIKKKSFSPEFRGRKKADDSPREKENLYNGDGEWPKPAPRPFIRKQGFDNDFPRSKGRGNARSRPNRRNEFSRNNEVKPFREKKGFGTQFSGKKPFQKGRKKKDATPDTKTLLNEPFRLNKYLAHAGIASRREADELIKSGFVTVNGQVVLEMGHKVQPGDEVRFKDRLISPEKKVYILLNKPKDYITTASDERGRPTVMDLVQNATEMRIYPVGRLDRNTTGLLLLTNDGELAQKLTHPSFEAKKVYLASLDNPLKKEDMQQIADGVKLEEGVAMVDAIEYADPKDRRKIGIELHIGWNKVVRRIFEQLGYEVVQLDRVYYAGLTKDVPRGKWRRLTEKEVIMLKHFS